MSGETYFISYTTRTGEDIAWAKWTEWVLRVKLGAKTIMQEYDSRPSDNLMVFMDDALKDADVVVGVLTSNYMESKYCTLERTNARKFIAVKFDDCKPEGLLKSQVYIDLYGLDEDSALDKLIKQIKITPHPIEKPEVKFEPIGAGKSPPFPKQSATIPNLPGKNRFFTGRETDLAKIEDGLKSAYVVIVTGPGGIGKTQTAVEYAHLHTSEYNLIWYFNAESETQLQNGYREFAIFNLGFTEAMEAEFDVVHADGKDEDFTSWFKDRIATYPTWCEDERSSL